MYREPAQSSQISLLGNTLLIRPDKTYCNGTIYQYKNTKNSILYLVSVHA